MQRAPNLGRRPAETEEEGRRHIRLNDNQFHELLDEFHAYRVARAAGARLVTSNKKLKTFLEYLASGGYYRNTAKAEGMAKSTVILHTRDAVAFFLEICGQHVRLPALEEYPVLAQPLVTADGQEVQAVLFIDGVIIRIQRPDHAGNAYYCGRNGKACDSLNVQVVCDRFGVIRYALAGVPGAAHDANAIGWGPR